MTTRAGGRAAFRIALLGAESTGKTQLAAELAEHLRSRSERVSVMPEFLREWVVREGRAPRPEEQLAIAQQHERRVDAASETHDTVIADTTALMVAIYSGMLFEDGALYRFALERQRTYDIALVTGLDLAWKDDGLQRAGPHVRESVDALVREALRAARVDFRVIYGSGPERLANALAAMRSVYPEKAGAAAAEKGSRPKGSWTWSCEKCSDPDCEHRLFTGLGRRGATGS